MVLLLAWETWCPTWGFLPVTWQTRAMAMLRGKGAHYRSKPGARSSSTPQQRIRRGSSQQPAFGKGHRAAACNDEMVEHLNIDQRSEEHTSELQSLAYLVCRLLLEKKKRTSHP